MTLGVAASLGYDVGALTILLLGFSLISGTLLLFVCLRDVERQFEHLKSEFLTSVDEAKRDVVKAIQEYAPMSETVEEHERKINCRFEGAMPARSGNSTYATSNDIKKIARDTERKIVAAAPRAKDMARLRERTQATERRVLGALEEHKLNSQILLSEQSELIDELSRQLVEINRSLPEK